MQKLLILNNEFKFKSISFKPVKNDKDIKKASKEVNIKTLVLRFILIIFLIKP